MRNQGDSKVRSKKLALKSSGIVLAAALLATGIFAGVGRLDDLIAGVTGSVDSVVEPVRADYTVNSGLAESDADSAEYEIKYDLNGGHAIDGDGTSLALSGMSYEDDGEDVAGAVGAPADMVVSAASVFNAPDISNACENGTSVFTGWNTAPDGGGIPVPVGAVFSGLSFSWAVDGDAARGDLMGALDGNSVTLYAQWSNAAYEIRFSANGGEGEMDPVPAIAGTPVVLPECGFSYEGHSFYGWALSEDGAGGYFEAGQSVSGLQSDPDQAAVLFAQWSEDGEFDSAAADDDGSEDEIPEIDYADPDEPVRSASILSNGSADFPISYGGKSLVDTLKLNAKSRSAAPRLLSASGGDTGFHIAAAIAQQVSDGTGPFDSNNNAGNDANDHNGIVRSFDNIMYTIGYTTELNDPTVPVPEGNINAYISLAKSPKSAEIEIDVLAWMKDMVVRYTYKDGYVEEYSDENSGSNWKGTIDQRDWHFDGELGNWDHGDIVLQEVSGYRYLSAQTNSIPGAGTLVVSVNSKAAKNGETIQPTMKLWSNGNPEVAVTGIPSTRVSAAPMYDVRITYDSNNTGHSWMYLDPDAGVTYAYDQGDSTQKGRLYSYGVTFALRNSDPSKGFKGVAMPEGVIQYDLRLESSFTPANAVDETIEYPRTDVDGWTPYLWDSHESGRPYYNSSLLGNGIWADVGGTPKIVANRQMRDFSSTGPSQPTYAAPYNEHSDDPSSETQKRYEASCYNGGNMTVWQDSSKSNVYHVVLSDFDIDYKNLEFPSRIISTGYSSYLATSGTITSSHFMVACPISKSQLSGTEHLSAYVENLVTKTAGEEGYYARTETDTTNNLSGHALPVYGPGTYTHYVYFGDNPNWDAGDFQSYAGRRNRLVGTVNTTAETNFKGVNYLMKFDDEFAEIPAGTTSPYAISVGVPVDEENQPVVTTLFAAKPDGSGWASDEEMQNATEESLVYFSSIDDLTESGMTCVGVLVEARGQFYKDPRGQIMVVQHVVKTLRSAENSAVYQIMADTRTWSEASGDPTTWTDQKHVNADGITYYGIGDISWTHDRFTTVQDGVWHEDFQYKDGYARPTYTRFVHYAKTRYANGSIVGGHTGNQYGDSALIIGDASTIDIKSVVSSGSEKTAYDLDNGERIALWKVTAAAEFVSANQALTSEGLTDNLTVTVTIPKDLTYIEGSASATPISVKKNADGTTELVFRAIDVPVGGEGAEFTFLTRIGHIGQSDDVDNNTRLTVETSVVPDLNPATPSETEGTIDNTTIRVIKLSASAVAKENEFNVADLGASNAYYLHYGNSSEITATGVTVFDILPYNGDGRDSDFHGGYRVESVSVDLSDAASVNLGAVNAYMTQSAGTRSKNAQTMGELGNVWTAMAKTANATARTVSFSVPAGFDASKATAIRIDYGDVGAHEYTHATLRWSPRDASGQMIKDASGGVQQGLDSYSNTFSQWSSNQALVVNSNLMTEQVIARTIRGLAWLDADHDGLRGDDEELLAGIPVSLRDAAGNPVKSLVTGANLTATTAADGSYEFTAVPAGTFHVVFENTGDLDLYAATIKNALVDGEPQSDRDSDVVANNTAAGKIATLDSNSIWMPLATQIPDADYLVEHVDAGVTPKSGMWQPAALKTLANRDLMNQFSFEVVDENGHVVSTGKSNTSDGRITFEPVTYIATDAGRHVYKVREVNDGQPGITYDLTEYDVVVTVEDTGEANMGVSEDKQSIAWTGQVQAFGDEDATWGTLGGGYYSLASYGATSGAAISGAAFEKGKSYTLSYKMRKTAGILTGIGGYASVTPQTAFVVDGKAYESYAAGAALPNDKDIHSVQFSFTYTGDGEEQEELSPYECLTIIPNKNSSEAVAIEMWDVKLVEDPVVKNEYHAEGDFTPTGYKVLNGRALEDGQFSYELLDADENVIDTVSNDKYAAAFGAVHYTEQDAPGVYTYYIREVDDKAPGYTYEPNTRTVRVTVLDNYDGTLSITASSYSNMLAGEDFASSGFGSTVAAGKKTDHWIVAADNGVVRMQVPASSLEGGGKRYRLSYKVKALSGDPVAGTAVALGGAEADVTYVDGSRSEGGIPGGTMLSGEDPHRVDMYFTAGEDPAVTVYPIGLGAATGEYEVYDLELADVTALPRFTNTYKASGSWVPAVQKNLSGRDIATNQFRFEISRNDGEDLTGKITGTSVNKQNDGSVRATGSVTLPVPDGNGVAYGDSGTWAFEIKPASNATLTIDENNAYEDGSGSASGDNDLWGASEAYANQRIGLADGSAMSPAAGNPANMETDLSGGSWHAVTYTYSNDSPSNSLQQALKESGTTLSLSAGLYEIRNLRFVSASQFALNALGGTTTFPRIWYDESDAGKTYTYQIREQDLAAKGYQYDHHVEQVSVSIVDNGDGTLTVTPDYGIDGTDGAEFDNVYAAKGYAELVAWKVLRGRELEDGEFSFSLYDGGGNKVASGTNDEDGVVRFSGIEFNQETVGKTYYFTAKEDAGSDDTVVYTGDEFHYAVTVADDGNGTLSFEVENVSSSHASTSTLPVFVNGLKDGSVAIEKRTAGGAGDETFTYRLKLQNDDGSPLDLDIDELITVEPLPDEGGAQMTAQSMVGRGGAVLTEGIDAAVGSGSLARGESEDDSDDIQTASVRLPKSLAAIGSSTRDAATPSYSKTYNYTGGVQTFTAPYTGVYTLEVWGAAGGGSRTASTEPSHSGQGGYSKGNVTLTKGQTIYVICGGKGPYGAGTNSFGGPVGGYNGGGSGGNSGSAGGGGMTHISLKSNPVVNTSWNPDGTLIVAGGGGGSDDQLTTETRGGANDGSGGDGGGTTGGNAWSDGVLVPTKSGYNATNVNNSGCGQGGTQTSGFARGMGESVLLSTDTGGAGGGWYGGYTTSYNNGGAGGGSGYINTTYVTNGSTSQGGNSGDGYAKITLANELIVDPNGGTWDDGDSASTEVRTYGQFTGTKIIRDPVREGYRFVGWIEVGTGKMSNIKGTNGDGAFTADTNNTVNVYNNARNGAVTHTRVSEKTPYGDQLIRIAHSPTLESHPQLGGFYYAKQSYANEKYLMIFVAKVPTGFYLQHSTNAIGDNPTETWITDRKGTGEWRTYAYTIQPGSTGNFSTTGHIFLTRDPNSEWPAAGSQPAAENVSWDLAYSEFYDITAGYSTFDFSTGASRLIAQWEPVSYKVNYHYQNDTTYNSGQYDTLGARMDLDKDNRIQTTFKGLDGASSSYMITSTRDGAGGLTAQAASGGRLSVTDGSSTGTSTGTLSAGTAYTADLNWDSTAKRARLQTSLEAAYIANVSAALSGKSANEVRIGATDYTRSYGKVQVSDTIWTIPYDKGESVSMPHPTRMGYDFLGWYTKPDGTGDMYAANQVATDLVSEGSIDLYAKWKVKTYTVAYNNNTGSGNMASSEFTWDVTDNLSHNTMKKFNYTFEGWNEKADGSGKAYSDSQEILNMLDPIAYPDYRMTLYAQWKKVSNSTQVEAGVWEITVPANGRVVVSGLPAGATYEVTELPKADWVLDSYENESGAIAPLETETAKFHNTYTPNSTSLSLSASKRLDGSAPSGSDFSFKLSGPKLAQPETVSNNGGGVTFSPIVFCGDDIGKSFTYTISEVAGSDRTLNYDGHTETVTVSVTRGTSGLEASAAYDADGAVFSNTTKPGSLSVSKSLSRATSAASAKTFEFPVTLTDQLGEPVAGTYTFSNGDKVVDGTGVLHLKGGETATLANVPAGTRYVVTETPPAAFTKGTVTGDSGTIVADKQSTASFENVYAASGSVVLEASKTMIGRDLAAGEFTFHVKDATGADIATAVNDGNGNIVFPAIPYTQADDGKTFAYTISEQDDGVADIAYDGRETSVTVRVSDAGGTGTMTAVPAYDGGSAHFRNALKVVFPTAGSAGRAGILIAAVALCLSAAIAGGIRFRRKAGEDMRSTLEDRKQLVLTIGAAFAIALMATIGLASSAWADDAKGAIRIEGTGDYTAYRLFSGDLAEGEPGTLYSVDYDLESAPEGFWGQLGIDQAEVPAVTAAGEVISRASDIRGAFAADAGDAIKEHGGKGVTLKDGTAVEVDAGYYIIVDDGSMLPVLLTVGAGQEREVIPKPTVPQVEKAVLGDDGKWTQERCGGTGTPLGYRIDASVPPSRFDYPSYEYRIIDELPGGMAVVGGAEGVRVTAVYGDGEEDVTGKADVSIDGSRLTVAFGNVNDVQGLERDASIRCEYEAELVAGAHSIGANAPNVNAAWIEYTSPDGEGTASSARSEARAYSFALEIHKVSAGSGQDLPGAVFALSSQDGKWLGADGSWYDDDGQAAEVTTGMDGKAMFRGLAPGAYELHELSAPEGYEKAEAAIPVRLEADLSGQTTLSAESSSQLAEIESVSAADGIATVKVADAEKQQSFPVTGDMIWKMAVLAAAAVAAIVVAVAWRKRRRG